MGISSTGGGSELGTGWLAEVVGEIRTQVPGTVAVEEHLCIAGCEVLIRYADSALVAALNRATRHLRVAEIGIPGLTIDCWTAGGPPSSMPSQPTTGTVYANDGNVVLTWDAHDGALFAYDRSRRHAWARFSSPAGPPPWEQATPFHRILHWWAADRGGQLVHAAAVGHSTGGLLLVGRSGSGKSTTSLACLEAGLGFAGDDYCLLAPGDPPHVFGLYVSAKGDARTATLLPGFLKVFAQSSITIGAKSVLFADQIRPDGICTGFPLRGIVIPEVKSEPVSRLSPLRSAAVLRALAPSTLFQVPGNMAGGLKCLASIVRNVPAWELTLGSDPAQAAALIKQLVDGELSA